MLARNKQGNSERGLRHEREHARTRVKIPQRKGGHGRHAFGCRIAVAVPVIPKLAAAGWRVDLLRSSLPLI